MTLNTHRSLPTASLDSYAIDVLVRLVGILAVLALAGIGAVVLHGTLLGVLVAGWLAVTGATASLFAVQRLGVAFLER